ncbi:MAG: 30S ribosomal protein S8 [Syntrophaceae bacterium]|nr:30S ribosomal protein S8 [Syntrophaceae bacterium]
MGMTDPIADMITRIRNANRVHFKSVDVFVSRMNQDIAKVLLNCGYIEGFEKKKDEKRHDVLRIYLKYTEGKKPVLNNLQRVSKPGRRVYLGKDEIPRVLNGYGVSIITTSKGVMTDKEARAMNVGGEVLCNVW